MRRLVADLRHIKDVTEARILKYKGKSEPQTYSMEAHSLELGQFTL